MGDGRPWRLQRSADSRVLRAQLGLICDLLYSARYVAPLWALCAALLASEVGPFGNAGLHTAMLLPAAVAAASLLAAVVVRRYHVDSLRGISRGRLEAWFAGFVAVQMAISAAWGLMPWLLWQHGNAMNHIFLALVVAAILSWLIVSRVSHIDMFVTGIMPMLAMADLRYLLSDTYLDAAIALVLTVYAGQMFYDGRRLTRRIDEDSRLRFEVEDLATKLEEARDEALRKRFEAEAANASKTSFLANMSHELRTPLNAILGFSEIIAEQCFGPLGSPRYIEYAHDINGSGHHLLSLINDLLDVAKIEAGRMEITPMVLDAQANLELALKLVGAKARERHQALIITTADDAPPLYADERAFKQILINLVTNAVKFTPDGGHIRVLGGPAAEGGGFQLMVEDDGPGIPREKLDGIFQPFSQVDNRYDRQCGGTGLGLALVRGLCELHRGRVWLESEPGQGCRVYVIFPPPPEAVLGSLPRKQDATAVA